MRENAGEMRQLQPSASGEAPHARPLVPADWGSWIRLLGWMLLPGLFLGIIGPFGSFGAPLAQRLIYWIPTMAAGALVGWVLSAWLERQPWAQGKPILQAVLLALMITVFMIGIVWGWAWVAFQRDVVPVSLTLVLYVLVVSAAMAFLGSLVERFRTAEPSAPAPAPAVAVGPAPELLQEGRPAVLGSRPALANRLKPGLRQAQILALEAEDHYVRVHTDQGSDLILIRLTDAIAEMAPVAGARTHRSWWVARAAVMSVRRDNGRMTLLLTHGAEAPVSRSAAQELSALGWT